MLQLLETTQMTSEQAEYSALATESTEHLLKVINDILDFSRIERGALELESIPFNFAELVHSSIQVLRHRTEQRGLALKVEIQPGLGNFDVLGDPTRIRQILINLTGNALKFTEAGGIRIEVQWRVRDEQKLWLHCAIHDTGIGIEPEELARMFSPFQQADNSISRRYGGTGLGLAIARTLAEHMGGLLNGSSTPGQGSIFHFELTMPFRHRPLVSRNPVSQIASERRTVLLLEDNPVSQSVVQGMLHSLGYDVCVVSTGTQAIQAVRRQAIAGILLKCQLSEMDGYQTAQRIRQLNEGRQLPIIALPSGTQPIDHQACAEAGIDDILPTPFKRADLQKILLHWLSSPRRMTGQD
jgi:CheY-like chemotaxis protein